METLYFCPLSARFSTSSFELMTPSDTQIQSFDASFASARAVLDALEISVIEEAPNASDACFAAFSMESDRTVLVSWDAYDADDLECITDELLLAAGHPAQTGIERSLVSPKGHVVVVVDYQPVAENVDSVDRATAVIEDLQTLHHAGLIHGGINDRFLNPEHDAGRRVFGVGLSETYAAWRRGCGLEIGDLRADPRFGSPEDLQGEPASVDGDRFALAATILSEVQDPGAHVPATDPVQGVNALLAKARQRALLNAYVKDVPDRRVREYLIAMLQRPKEPELRMWRITVLIVCGLSALMLLWLVIPSASQSNPPETPAPTHNVVKCRGASVSIVDGRCEPSDGYGRCGDGTRYNGETGMCELVPQQTQADTNVAKDAADNVPNPEHYIHPVKSCSEGEREISGRFSFSDDDLDFTSGERRHFARLASQCSGTASIIYYVSKPDMIGRAHTTYKEFRSSSSCRSKCQTALPKEPTSVVYVPYIGAIDRSAEHYLFLHCCP